MNSLSHDWPVLLIDITVMYRGAELVVLYFCTFDTFSYLDEAFINLFDDGYELFRRLKEVYLFTLFKRKESIRRVGSYIIRK